MNDKLVLHLATIFFRKWNSMRQHTLDDLVVDKGSNRGKEQNIKV